MMRMTSNGLGIGTTDTPYYPFEVQKTTTWQAEYVKLYVHPDYGSSGGKPWQAFGNGNTLNAAGNANRIPSDAQGVSAKFWGAIHAKGYYSSSDERIKENIVDISDNQALIALRKLKPKTYNYKSVINDVSKNVYGFIAQEVEEVLPYSVSREKQYIPNIMDLATVSDIQYETETESESCILTFDTAITDISVNDYICCCDSSLNKIDSIEIIEIIDSNTIKINKSFTPEQITFPYIEGGVTTNSIIVEGKLVDDFRVLEKNGIWAVATAALQEVDRQLQAEKSKVETLENQVLTLNSELTAIKTHLGL